MAKYVLRAKVYTHGKADQRLSKDKWRDYVSNLAWSRLGVESEELSEMLLIVRYFGSPRLRPQRLSPKKKRARKWVNEWVCRPTLKPSTYEIVFSLFAKSECHIQIIEAYLDGILRFCENQLKYQT